MSAGPRTGRGDDEHGGLDVVDDIDDDTTRPRRFVSGWHAVGQYWSRGVASLCRAGLPVTAIARPCRPEGVGSEYIAAVVDSNDSTVTYADGARVQVGTQMTVVVATGRLCE